ncbi:MAG: DinB family protein [Terriglobales bacterium]
MNPYATFLGSADPIAVLAETPEKLRAFVHSLQAHMDTRPAPGKWTPREILAHLADEEIVFGFRYRQAVAEDHYVVQPMDQNRWARAYSIYSSEQAVALFTAVRAWNLVFLRLLSTEQWAKPLTHPERGTMTFRVLVETGAGHDLNHLSQLAAAQRAVA